MSTQQSTIDFILDQLSALPDVRARKMFGDYALYCDEKVVGLVCDDELFVKVTQQGKDFIKEEYEEGIPYPGAKPYIHISEKLDDSQWICQLIQLTAHSLPIPKPRKKKTRQSK